ncbi:MAG: phosphoribosylglycinamide formyltransferase [Acidobacteriota bacterium]
MAILLSGRGSNFLALHRAIEERGLPAQIALVVSDRPAAGITHARDLGLPAAVIPRQGEPSRQAHERKVLEALGAAGVEWVCLAGYMRLLSPSFVAKYPRRIVNIHPSLLPAFPGLEAQRQALDHGVKVAGCTVHLVDEVMDNGPVVVQRSVPVYDGDRPEDLAARILEQEHQAYPEALERLLSESWEVEGRRLIFGPSTGAGRKKQNKG